MKSLCFTIYHHLCLLEDISLSIGTEVIISRCVIWFDLSFSSGLFLLCTVCLRRSCKSIYLVFFAFIVSNGVWHHLMSLKMSGVEECYQFQVSVWRNVEEKLTWGVKISQINRAGRRDKLVDWIWDLLLKSRGEEPIWWSKSLKLNFVANCLKFVLNWISLWRYA